MARRSLDEIVARAEADAAFRARSSPISRPRSSSRVRARPTRARRAQVAATRKADPYALGSPAWTWRGHRARYTGETLPAWSLPKDDVDRIALPSTWPERVTREWAWGGSTGKGVRVCILDSGVEAEHPLVGGLDSAVAVSLDENDEMVVTEDEEGDLSGHGTACAGIVRALAPDCSLASVRVLGAGFTGSGGVLLAGLRYAVEQGFDVINMSLSTTKKPFAASSTSSPTAPTSAARSSSPPPTTCRSRATPGGSRRSSPSGATRRTDPLTFFYNPNPPVEYFGRGVNVEVAWLGGRMIRVSGNSFATPHMTGICALCWPSIPS